MTNEITQNLPKLINESYERATNHAERAKGSAVAAITEAQHCGLLLTKAKDSLAHGEWLGWLESNCPHISCETARKYMLLSNSNRDWNLEKCHTLTDAYRKAGILPEPEKPNEQAGGIPKIDGAHDWIQRACQYFNTHDLFKLPEQDRQQWKEKLRPLVELYEKL